MSLLPDEVLLIAEMDAPKGRAKNMDLNASRTELKRRGSCFLT